jgi:hypothetical protein
VTSTNDRLARVFDAIDAANAKDPRTTVVDGAPQPSELVYGRRITATLARMIESPSEALRIAIRGQHIERWRIPRTSYPQGRAGYLAWRKLQRANQAVRLGEIMTAEGYADADIARVGVLIRKENMKTDAEVQTFEDVICVMFFEHYLQDFVHRVEPEKLAEILRKTWNRMSPLGHRYALMLPLPPLVVQLMEREGIVQPAR